jgi:hypothetical protein
MMAYGPRYRHGGYCGGKEQPLHYIWRSMMARCYNPKSKDFERYGGRGIRVVKRWHDYKNFSSDMGPYPVGMTLERENNNRWYGPANCKWATPLEQNRNKRNNVYLMHRGKRMTLTEWAGRLGMSKELAHWRFKNWGTLQKGKVWVRLPNTK